MGGNHIDTQMGQGRYRHYRRNQISGGDRHAHAQNQRGEGDKEDRQNQRAIGQFDNDIGKGEYQTTKGEYTDNNTDNANGGTDLEAALSTIPCCLPKNSLGPILVSLRTQLTTIQETMPRIAA